MYVHTGRAGLKNMPGHGGNRTYELWNTSPMLCQLSYAVRSVRVCDISELSPVPSINYKKESNLISCCYIFYKTWRAFLDTRNASVSDRFALEFLEVDPRACSQATTSLPILHPWCKSMNDGRGSCAEYHAYGTDRYF